MTPMIMTDSHVRAHTLQLPIPALSRLFIMLNTERIQCLNAGMLGRANSHRPPVPQCANCDFATITSWREHSRHGLVEDDHLASAVCFFFTQVFGSIFHSRAVFFHMIFSMFSGEMGATPRFFATLPKLWNISTAMWVCEFSEPKHSLS